MWAACLDPVAAEHVEQAPDLERQLDLGEAALLQRGDELGDLGLVARVVRRRGMRRRLVEDAGHGLAVAGREREQHLGGAEAVLVFQPADEAEVEQHHGRRCEEAHVARMEVGVDEAMREDHPADAAHPGCDDPVNVDVRGLEIPLVHAVDEVHREDRVAAELRMQAREPDFGVRGEVRREPVVVLGLRAEVELLLDRAAERSQRALQRDETQRRDEALEGAPEEQQDRAVEGDLLRDVRPPDLHRDVGAAGERRAVHLRHGRRGDRLRVERGEVRLERTGEVALDDLADPVERERRHLVPERRELADDRCRQEVGARGRDLADLDEGRPELVTDRDQRPPGRAEPGVAPGRPAPETGPREDRGPAPERDDPVERPEQDRQRTAVAHGPAAARALWGGR